MDGPNQTKCMNILYHVEIREGEGKKRKEIDGISIIEVWTPIQPLNTLHYVDVTPGNWQSDWVHELLTDELLELVEWLFATKNITLLQNS